MVCNAAHCVIQKKHNFTMYEIHLACNLQGYIMSCVDLMVWHYRSRVYYIVWTFISRMLRPILEFIISDIPLLE